ncbi:MAG: acyloxyacyl hydrolase [Rickettsiales bacterium]|jgi:hypothetical protein|nr:acyloxyacyl hydrolase [Rickettsiales bacterium]
MRKNILILLAAMLIIGVASVARGARENPLFGDTQSQFGLNAGHGVGGGNIWRMVPFNDWRIEPFGAYWAEYSQPFEFFRLPARQTLHAGMFAGYEDMSRNYTEPFLGLSWDVVPLSWRGAYVGAGLGVYIKPTFRGRQDSLLMFGEKLFAGYRISAAWSVELWTRHFDSGGLTPINGGYNFFGLSALYNF